jgi:hypothetical protein
MAGFHFIDHAGTSWMVLAGLPADFPDESEGDGSLSGLTFRAETGEVRVLARAAIPRLASIAIPLELLGTQSRLRGPKPANWEALLRRAVAWPPA